MWDFQQDVAVETLYAWYCEEKKDASDILPSKFVSTTLYDVVRQQPLIDKILEKHAENWAFERIAKVDLAILRLAVYELKFAQTPPPVVINEAIELAKEYASDDSKRFINGMLDRIAKEVCCVFFKATSAVTDKAVKFVETHVSDNFERSRN